MTQTSMDVTDEHSTSGLSPEEGHCCLCGGRDGRLVVTSVEPTVCDSRATFSFRECSQCGILFLDPRPADESLHLLYRDDEYYSRDFEQLAHVASQGIGGLKQRIQRRIIQAYGLAEADQRRRLIDLIGKLSLFPIVVRSSALLRTLIYNRRYFRFDRRPARVLEVGFGNGLLLHALSALNVELYGTEISPKACETIASNLGAKTYCGEMWEAGYPEHFFDLVIFSHSLEHLADPLRALREARRVLADRGKLLISLPNPDCLSAKILGSHWLGYDFPRHLFLFGRRALSNLVNEAGFGVSSVSFPLEFSLGHLASSINSRCGRRLIPDFVPKIMLAQALYLPLALLKTADVMTVCCRPHPHSPEAAETGKGAGT